MEFIMIPVFVLYVLVSIIIVACSIIYALRHHKNFYLWGFGVAFIMYNLIFWDWLPTVLVHKYYCSTQAGFWIYKTADEWKAENPGVLATSNLQDNSLTFQIQNGTAIQRHMINKRLVWEHRISKVFLSVRRYDDILRDVKSKSKLAERVYFESGTCSGAPKNISDMKVWLARCSCETTSVPFINKQGLSWLTVYNQFKMENEKNNSITR